MARQCAVECFKSSLASRYLFFARNLALPFKLYYAHKILESRNCGNAVNAFNTCMDLKDCQLNETHIIKR